MNGDEEKNIKRRMRACEKEGVWALLWDVSQFEPKYANMNDGAEAEKGDTLAKGKGGGRRGKRRRKRRRIGASDDEDEGAGGGKKKRKVSERGWVLLEWLVHVWERDQVERGGESFFYR